MAIWIKTIITAIFFTFLMILDEMFSFLDAWNNKYNYVFPLIGTWNIGAAWTWIVFPILAGSFLIAVITNSYSPSNAEINDK